MNPLIVVRGPHLASPMTHVFLLFFSGRIENYRWDIQGYPMFCKGMNMKNGCHHFVKQCTKYPGFWTDLLFPRNHWSWRSPKTFERVTKKHPKEVTKNLVGTDDTCFSYTFCNFAFVYVPEIYKNNVVFSLLVWQQRCLSPPRPNFQTFWEPLGKTILKETLKV